LRELMGDSAEFPTQLMLDAAGLPGLRRAISRSGGVERWAAKLGRQLRSAQLIGAIKRPRYTEEMALADAHAVIAMHGRLYGSTKLIQLGYPQLARVVAQTGGAAAFRRRHGLT
jgi:hypothetical protein